MVNNPFIRPAISWGNVALGGFCDLPMNIVLGEFEQISHDQKPPNSVKMPDHSISEGFPNPKTTFRNEAWVTWQ